MISAVDPFWGIFVTAVPALVAAVAAVLGARNSRRVNDAVNHRHENEPRLLDLVKETRKEVGQLRDAFIKHLQHHGEVKDEEVEEGRAS